MPASTGEITATQRDVYDLILTVERARGYVPTVAELARKLGMTPAAVREVLAALERKRLLRVVPYDARTLIVVEEGKAEKVEGKAR